MTQPASAEVTYKVLSYDDLDGWAEDDHSAALTVFQDTCRDMRDPDWKTLCAYATQQPDARAFFELLFRSVLIEDGNDALLTGYFEPELDGSRVRTARYRFPVYAMPPEAKRIRPWLTRRDILSSGVMDGRGLEIVWVDGRELLFHNNSYVFFRNVDQVPAHKRPLGAMNRSITTMRSVAVDPKFVTLGSSVWIEKDGKIPLRRLMTAQDTGSAIKGAQRADVFFGTGDKAGRAAGRLRDPGRMMVLMSIQRAYSLLPEET